MTTLRTVACAIAMIGLALGATTLDAPEALAQPGKHGKKAKKHRKKAKKHAKKARKHRKKAKKHHKKAKKHAKKAKHHGARPDRDGGKVLVCHVPPGNPGAAHVIRVGRPAVAAHRGHGDCVAFERRGGKGCACTGRPPRDSPPADDTPPMDDGPDTDEPWGDDDETTPPSDDRPQF